MCSRTQKARFLCRDSPGSATKLASTAAICLECLQRPDRRPDPLQEGCMLLKFRGITVAFAAVVAFGAASIPISAAALVGAAAEGGPGWDDGGRDVWQVVDQNTPRPSGLNRLSPRQIKPPGLWHGCNVWRVRAPLSSVSSGGGARLKLRCSAWRTVRDGGSLLGINPGHELLVAGHVDLEAAINRSITVAEVTIRRPRSLSIV
jgi:hypothetical protein